MGFENSTVVVVGNGVLGNAEVIRELILPMLAHLATPFYVDYLISSILEHLARSDLDIYLTILGYLRLSFLSASIVVTPYLILSS